MNNKTAFIKGLKDGVPICLGYLSVSFTFGMMCTENGLPFWISLLISMTNLTSAGQFAGTALLLSGGAYIEIAVTTFVINIRYMLMSLSLAQKADPAMPTWQRAVLSFGVTDEIFAVGMQQKGPVTAAYLAGLIFTPYWGWALGTLFGATATSLLPAVLRSALGVAIYGMFIAIIVPPARKVKPVAVVIAIAVVLSCVLRFTPILKNLSSGWAIILCAIAASAYAALRYPAGDEDEPEVAAE
ncbi:branched-chain amino acid ABC transporter permease [Anaerotruncus sp. AF02-27]|uniref:AzlC family ABC transporter permease n=1 Tax=Anaerotruncus TaxID=244127 RepID=UPI000E4F153B|nr:MULTISPECIES: AzlC family ABC transporter permease [Anaerotruncus]RGX56831.1 branched-chain amino acid ABC transporter permease [Anaerotruncus sp. AF02-27]